MSRTRRQKGRVTGKLMGPSSQKEVRPRIAGPFFMVEQVKMAGKIGSRGPSYGRDRMNIHGGTTDPPGLGPPVLFLLSK